MANKIVEIEKLATHFRKAIERADRNKLPITFEKFPRGSCGDAVILLGAYLIDAGIAPLKCVSTGNTDGSHAWLESDGVVIDITADQFDASLLKVIVVQKSRWHEQFDCTVHNYADFRSYDSGTVSRLSGPYQEILSHIRHDVLG